MIIERPKWRARWRGPGVCELCHLMVSARECFHVLAKGSGGGHCLDVRINCLSSCAAFSGGKNCHRRHHDGNLAFNGRKYRTEELLEIVAHREGISLDVDLLSCLYWLARLPKDATVERMKSALVELGTAEAGIAWAMLVESGKVKENAA